MTTTADQPSTTAGDGRRASVALLAVDVALPLALFYGLRLAGVGQWLALVLGASVPLIRLAVTIATQRRVDRLSLFTLSLIGVGTAIGLVTADPRLLLARESYLTAVVGLWILGSLLGRTPVIFEATLRLMPAAQAEQWRHDWTINPTFRRIMRGLTAAWGMAFLLDAIARVVMAYTLPVDVVPLASTGLLVVLLIIVVQGSKAYGRRHLGHPSTSETTPH